MKVALILCPAWSREMPHLAMAMLSACLRKDGHQVFNFDLNNYFYHHCQGKYKVRWLKEHDLSWAKKDFVSEFISENKQLIDTAVNKILETEAKIIGFSVYFSTELMSLELARRIKELDRERIIVFGGTQCLRENRGRALIEDNSVDVVAMGEGDLTLLELVRMVEQNRNSRISFCEGTILKSNEQIIDCQDRDPILDLDTLPFPDFTDFNLFDYQYPYALPVLFSRGCIQRCVFCTVVNSWKVYRSLSGVRIFEQIKYQLNNFTGLNDFHFYDPLINGNIKELHSFCDMVIEAVKKGKIPAIKWRGEGIIRPEMTRELLNKMRQAGCYQLAYGVESGSQRVLDKMRKRYRTSDADEVIWNTYEAGIQVATNFMFGFPTETRKDFEETLNFLRRNGKYINEIYPSESFCNIDKGTYLYSHAEEFGIPPQPHISFWESIDGNNAYPERIRRFEEFCGLAMSLNINLGSGYYKVKLNKEEDLTRYYIYKNNNQISSSC